MKPCVHFISSSIVFYTLSRKGIHIQVSNTISCQYALLKVHAFQGPMKIVDIMLEPAEESSFLELSDTTPNSNKQGIERKVLQ